MFQIVLAMNLVLRLLVELGALAALAVWGWHFPAGAVARVALTVGAPLIAATLWAVFASPAAPVQLGVLVRVGVQAVVLGGAAVALVSLGRPGLAAAFVGTALVNAMLIHLWQQ